MGEKPIRGHLARVSDTKVRDLTLSPLPARVLLTSRFSAVDCPVSKKSFLLSSRAREKEGKQKLSDFARGGRNKLISSLFGTDRYRGSRRRRREAPLGPPLVCCEGLGWRFFPSPLPPIQDGEVGGGEGPFGGVEWRLDRYPNAAIGIRKWSR